MGVPFARIVRSAPVPEWSIKEEMMATMLREFNVRAMRVPLESVRASMASRPIPAGVKWTPIDAPTVKGVWFSDYAPTEPGLTCLLYFHGTPRRGKRHASGTALTRWAVSFCRSCLQGGGHIFGHAGQIGPFAKVLLDHARAQGRKLAIFSVDYRLAPEHTYPADIDDAVAAYTHAVNELHLRPDHIVVGTGGVEQTELLCPCSRRMTGWLEPSLGRLPGGESSGGLVAVALVLRLRSERATLNLDLPAALALLSAKVNQHRDATTATDSMKAFEGYKQPARAVQTDGEGCS